MLGLSNQRCGDRGFVPVSGPSQVGGIENTMPEQANAALDDARKDAGLTQGELWLRYFELGGMSMPLEVEAYLFGLVTPSTHDREVLVHALNERFTELGRNHPVPHADDPIDEGAAHNPTERSPRKQGASEPPERRWAGSAKGDGDTGYCTRKATLWQSAKARRMKETEMKGLTGMGFSAVALIAGAVMYFAVTTHGTGFSVPKVGEILMIAGAIGVVISGIIFASTRRPVGSGHQTYDREAIDSDGRSTAVHEEVS